jgi:hypothetical protein
MSMLRNRRGESRCDKQLGVQAADGSSSSRRTGTTGRLAVALVALLLVAEMQVGSARCCQRRRQQCL